MQCKFIKKDGTQCRGTMLLEDGFCMHHSKSERAEGLRAKRGKKIGKEQKSIMAKKLKFPPQSPLKQIRKNCIECCENWREIMFCASVDCKLWYFRFGERPQSFVRNKGKEYARLFDRENFKKGGRYDPDTLIEEMQL
ncbi:hypothetical protein ES705_37443 [subsurface metagenome]